MSDMIHDFPLNKVQGFNWSHKDVRIDGYEDSREQLDALREIFNRAEGNVIRMNRPAGTPSYTDLTADQRNIRYCTFDTVDLISGWYALKKIVYDANKKGFINHYPWRISLYYIGTASGYQQYYELETFANVTNDWSI